MSMAFQTVLSKPIADRLVVLILKALSQVFDRSLVHWQTIYKMLVVDTHAKTRIAPNFTLGGMDFTGQKLQKR
jgi:hypothetical protein